MAATPGMAAVADGGDEVQRIIKSKTGSPGSLVTRGQTVGGVSVGTGRDGRTGAALETFAQRDNAKARVMAVLEQPAPEGVDFAVSLPEGAEAKPGADGSLTVIRAAEGAEQVEVLGTFATPWAVDAAGKNLPTHYTFANGTLTQNVDTSKAAFPVVADPYFRLGYYIIPVVYTQFTRSETVWVNGHLTPAAIFTGLLCSRFPVAGAVCVAWGGMYYWDISRNVDAALAVSGRCLKIRMPTTFGAIGIPAWDAYTHTCVNYA